MRTARAIVRFAAFVLLTFGIYAVWLAGTIFVGRKRRWREFIFRHWARGFVTIANLKLEVRGKPPAPPFLLVSNHVSYMDIPALRSVIECVYVAKGEIAEWFLAGTMIRNMGMIYINRENRRDIPRAGAEVTQAIRRGEGVVVFAEGTTSNGKQILPLKSSFLEFAAAQKLPVYYASVSYKAADGENPASESICWWREESTFGGHLFDLFKMPKFSGTIIFGDQPIYSENRKQLADKLWQAINAQHILIE